MASFGVTTVAALATLAGSEWAPETGGLREQYIQFKQDGALGHGGCNRFFGRYTFSVGEIKIGPLASTRMMCSPETMKAEQAFLSMLERAQRADATHKLLVLRDAGGAEIGRLRRRDWD